MHTRTTTALLEDLRDPANEAVWREFDGRYRGVLVAFAHRFGLQQEDAADAAQEALTQFVRSYRAGQYDRTRGRLSAWMIGIARHCILDQCRGRAARREERGLSALVEVPADDQLAALWEAQCRREILSQALQALRRESRLDPQTIQAFELLVLQHHTPAEVSAELGVHVNEVYVAKHRCLKRLRPIVSRLGQAYELEPEEG